MHFIKVQNSCSNICTYNNFAQLGLCKSCVLCVSVHGVFFPIVFLVSFYQSHMLLISDIFHRHSTESNVNISVVFYLKTSPVCHQLPFFVCLFLSTKVWNIYFFQTTHSFLNYSSSLHGDTSFWRKGAYWKDRLPRHHFQDDVTQKKSKWGSRNRNSKW